MNTFNFNVSVIPFLMFSLNTLIHEARGLWLQKIYLKLTLNIVETSMEVVIYYAWVHLGSTGNIMAGVQWSTLN